jgi:succinyl-CoA synthetase alpha subunit
MMGILVNKNTQVLIQGITGRLGSLQTQLMLNYGTKIKAGVTPGKGGKTIHGIPVYDSVKDAIHEHNIDASVIYVPAPIVKDAVFEAIDGNIPFLVIITDWVPIHDALEIYAYAKRNKTRYIGPNCPGIIVPEQTSLGMLSPSSVIPGRIGIVSRSGTLTGEITSLLTKANLGQSVNLGIGGDPIIGMRTREILELLEADEHTDIIVIIGEIGGTMEEEAALYIQDHITKPVVAFIAGQNAPPEKRMGHAGAIITQGHGTAQSKISALKRVGVHVVDTPFSLPSRIQKLAKK